MTVVGVRTGLTRLAVPVEPDAGTARRWAEEELAKTVYQEQPNLVQIVLDWILEQFFRVEEATGTVDPRVASVVLITVVVVIAVVVLVVAGPVRRRRKARSGSVDVFGDDTRTAEQLRASADRLAAEGRFSEAVLDRFRAILRSLEDRAILDERPGRTAHEAAEESAARLPGVAADLRAAGALFDDVCYGDVVATSGDDARLRDVDRRVAEARPVAPAIAPTGAEADDLAGTGAER